MRRTDLNVWPAIADLMLILAVFSVSASAVLLRDQVADSDSLLRQLEEEERAVQSLESQLDDMNRRLEAERLAHEEDRQSLAGIISNLDAERGALRAEVVRNREMLGAVNLAQQIIADISDTRTLRFTPDQSLEFGSDLVDFDLNRVEPKWRPQARQTLRSFCDLLSSRFESTQRSTSMDPFSAFLVEVEGHTDSVPCIDDPSCNWKISAGRAAAFLEFMQRSGECRGIAGWRLRSIAYADTRPPILPSGSPGPPRRRISLRLVPDYQRLLRVTP